MHKKVECIDIALNRSIYSQKRKARAECGMYAHG